MVTEVRRLADSEQALREAKPIELPLAWTRSNPPLTVAAVHPGSERHINVLYVDGPGRDDTEIARKWSETMPAQFDLHPKPAGGRDMLEPGQLRDRGRGSRPQLGRHRYDIPVSWDGKWSGKADMWDHLRERREAAAGHRQHERRVDRARLDGSEPSPRAGRLRTEPACCSARALRLGVRKPGVYLVDPRGGKPVFRRAVKARLGGA